MAYFKCIIFPICIFLLSYIKTDNTIPIWEKVKKEKILNISDINSYIFDPDRGDELFLYENKKKLSLLFKNGTNLTFENEFELQDLQPNLVKSNESYFFCSSSSKQLLVINRTGIYKIENPDEIKEREKKKIDFSLKCFLCYHTMHDFDGEDSLMVAFIGTEKLYFIDPVNNSYVYYNYSFDEDKIREIISINRMDFGQGETEYRFIVLTKDNNENQYYFYIVKKANNFIDRIQNKMKSFNNTILKNKTEISANIGLKNDNIAYLFSYNPDSKDNDFIFYVVDIESYTKGQFDARHHLSFFNDFKIKYVKFIDKTPYLYYLVEDFSNANTKYLGLVDLQYFMVLYNIKEEPKGILYFNFGNRFENKLFLFYFSENKKISHCPFVIDNKNECVHNTSNKQYFYIQLLDTNIHKNELLESCESKLQLGPYCVENCIRGFMATSNKCEFCNVFDNKTAYIKQTETYKYCISKTECNFETKNGICYNCQATNERNIYYEENCIDSCREVYGKYSEIGNTCIPCKNNDNNNTYYSFNLDQCIPPEECKAADEDINTFFNYCKECVLNENNTLFFKYNNSHSYCLEECPIPFVKDSDSCVLCEDNKYYQEGKCVNECNINDGYGFYYETNIIYNFYNLKYCKRCLNISDGYFLRGNFCEVSCGSGYLIKDVDKHICKACGLDDEHKYYVNKIEECLENCPKGSRKVEENVCFYCDQGQYYYHNKSGDIQCLSKNKCDIIINHTQNNNDIPYGFEECIICEDNEIIIGDKCFNCFIDNNYLYNEICYKCFCAGNFTCIGNTNQCNCEKENDTHYYGYSCEFYSEENIIENDMKIISLNNRLIKTSQNFFTYEFKNGTKISDNYYFTWKLFINDVEIGDEKKEYFITSKNEQIFGINKEIFEDKEYKNFSISLEIRKDKNDISRVGKNRISLIILEPFEYDIAFEKRMNYGGLKLTEMNNNLILENKNNLKSEKDVSKGGRYLFQYGLLDIHNERIPLTNYIESDSTNINVICSKGYYINIKNDREEINNDLKENEGCTPFVSGINDIIDEKNYFMVEKIFLLISNLRQQMEKENMEIINENVISKLIDYINTITINSTIINENGYYEEEKNKEKTNITFFEPKILFSLIYHLNNYMKSNLNEGYINNFLKFFDVILDQAFIVRNGTISKKTLSESDIISFFRIIDNFYDICIEENKKNIYNNIRIILNKLSKYLAYKSYPSQTIRLTGKRLSLFAFNIGKHETIISLPYIYKSFDTNIEDLSTYIYNDYYSN